MNNEPFTYRFDLDRDYYIDIGMAYQSILPFVILATIRPLIFLILMKNRDRMASDIRWGYIVNQVAMMAHEFNFCFLFRIHTLAPYAGLYCDGPLCRMGIEKHYLMTILAFTTIGSVPTFLFLLLRMHQLIIASTKSKVKLPIRSLVIIIQLMTVVLMSNVVGFHLFGRECSNAEQLATTPDLAWLQMRGGTLFIFGPPGKTEFFYKELILLACSLSLIAPFIVFATLHSIIVMHRQKETFILFLTFSTISSRLLLQQVLTSITQSYQTRLSRVFLLQLIGVHIFYLLPLGLLLIHMTIDVSLFFPPLLISLGRCFFVTLFTLENTQLSLLFLLKNPAHRKIIQEFFKCSNIRNSSSRVSVIYLKKTMNIAR